MNESNKQSPLEENIAWYFQEEAKTITMSEEQKERIVQEATSPSPAKRIQRRGFRLFARGAMAVATTAALVAAGIFAWNLQQGTSAVDAEEIMQRAEQTYTEAQTLEDTLVFGFAQTEEGSIDVPLPGYDVDVTELLPGMRELYDVTKTGEETLEGRDYYILLATPLGADELPEGVIPVPPGDEIEIWVDKETNLVQRAVLYLSSPEELDAFFGEFGDIGVCDVVVTDEELLDHPPGFSLDPEPLTYEVLLEDLGQFDEVTEVSRETDGDTIHYVLSLTPKDVELPPPPDGVDVSTADFSLNVDVWVDAVSGEVTDMEFGVPDMVEGGEVTTDSVESDDPAPPEVPGLETLEAEWEEPEPLTYELLLEDFRQVAEVTVVSEETVDGAIHYVLSLTHQDPEGLLPGDAEEFVEEIEVWVDADSGLVTDIQFPDAEAMVTMGLEDECESLSPAQ